MDIKSLEKALKRLDQEIIYPASLFPIWQRVPGPREHVPNMEISSPWYENIENYLT